MPCFPSIPSTPSTVLPIFFLFLSLFLPDKSCANDGISLFDCMNAQLCSPCFQKQVYATSDALLDRAMTSSLFPDTSNQGGDNHTCGIGSKYFFTDSCSQLHMPATVQHESYGFEVEYVEQMFSQKWANLMSSTSSSSSSSDTSSSSNSLQYDAFLDNNMAFWAADLSSYYSLWSSLEVDIVLLRWYADIDIAQEHPMYSIITHHEGTLSQYEIISDKFDNYDLATLNFVESESRAYFNRQDLADYKIAIKECTLYPIGARRSVSSVEENVKWYEKIFAATMKNTEEQVIFGEMIDYKGDVVKYAHVRVEGTDVADSVTVSFFERSGETRSTFGELTVEMFENGMNSAHSQALLSPFCGIDRWFDMHYGLTLSSSDEVIYEVFETIVFSGEKYSLYTAGVTDDQIFVYMPEPNGHSLQIVLDGEDRIEWLYDVNSWDREWCPTTCTEEQQSIAFGDSVFVWRDESLLKKEKKSVKHDEEEKELISSNDTGSSNGLKITFDLFVVVCVALAGVFVLGVFLLSVKCLRRRKRPQKQLETEEKQKKNNTQVNESVSEYSALLA